jgi:hypothetical protein
VIAHVTAEREEFRIALHFGQGIAVMQRLFEHRERRLPATADLVGDDEPKLGGGVLLRQPLDLPARCESGPAVPALGQVQRTPAQKGGVSRRGAQRVRQKLEGPRVGFAGAGASLGQKATGVPEIAPEEIAVGTSRQLKRLLIDLRSLRIEPLGEVEDSQVGVKRRLGLDLQRLLKLGGGLGQVAVEIVCSPQVALS